MDSYICKICCSPLLKKDGLMVCQHCGNIFESGEMGDSKATKSTLAWEALRDSQFEKAVSLFEELINDDPSNYEFYWGLALSKNEISFVVDLSEDKRVPIFGKIPDEPFLTSSEVISAIKNAPKDIAYNYRKLSDSIDKVRDEWIEKASKEAPYDIFLSYKESDIANGISRTQDSVDAQDLYNELTADGYRVFFSRVSLKNKVAEQYEPYIYNALDTAKVMIVFGEKAEYFHSAWIKNEWTRFKYKIEKGEKHSNGLVVVYKDVFLNDLPTVLNTRQCLNLKDLSFYRNLERHIKRVIEESEKLHLIDRVKVEKSKGSKKSSTISGETIDTVEIGKASSKSSEGENQQLDIVKAFLLTSNWADAESYCNNIIAAHPYNAKALWYKVLALSHANSTEQFSILTNLSHFKEYDLLQKAIEYATKDFAGMILDALYSSSVGDNEYSKILNVILPYNYSRRSSQLDDAMKKVIQNGMQQSFDLLIKALEINEVDKFIEYNLGIANNVSAEDSIKYINKVLDLDSGNSDAYLLLVKSKIKSGNDFSQVKDTFEMMVRYSSDSDASVKRLLKWLAEDGSISNEVAVTCFEQVIRYHSDQIHDLKDIFVAIGNRALKSRQFDKATGFFKLVDSKEAYRGLLLASIKAENENAVLLSNKNLQKSPYYKQYLALLNENEKVGIINLAKKQEEMINEKMNSYRADNDRINKEIGDMRKTIKKGNSYSVTFIILTILAVAGLLISYLSPSTQLKAFMAFAVIPMLLVVIIMTCSTAIREKKSWGFFNFVLFFFVGIRLMSYFSKKKKELNGVIKLNREKIRANDEEIKKLSEYFE